MSHLARSFFREAAGDENWRAWRVDLETGDVRPLTPGPGVTCYVQQSSRHFPSELLIAYNARDKRYFDIYRVNVATGESALLQLNEGVPAWIWTTTLATAPSRRETIVSMDVYSSLSRRPGFIAGCSAQHPHPNEKMSGSFLRLLRHNKPGFAFVCAVGRKHHPN